MTYKEELDAIKKEVNRVSDAVSSLYNHCEEIHSENKEIKRSLNEVYKKFIEPNNYAKRKQQNRHGNLENQG